jgi:hypothetical protein
LALPQKHGEAVALLSSSPPVEQIDDIGQVGSLRTKAKPFTHDVVSTAAELDATNHAVATTLHLQRATCTRTSSRDILRLEVPKTVHMCSLWLLCNNIPILHISASIMSKDLTNAFIGTQSFLLAIYMCLLSIVDFTIQLILSLYIEPTEPSNPQYNVSERPRRRHFRRLREKLHGHPLSPSQQKLSYR